MKSMLRSNMEEYVCICDLSNWHSELDISHFLNDLNLTQINLGLGKKCPEEKNAQGTKSGAFL